MDDIGEPKKYIYSLNYRSADLLLARRDRVTLRFLICSYLVARIPYLIVHRILCPYTSYLISLCPIPYIATLSSKRRTRGFHSGAWYNFWFSIYTQDGGLLYLLRILLLATSNHLGV